MNDYWGTEPLFADTKRWLMPLIYLAKSVINPDDTVFHSVSSVLLHVYASVSND